MLRLPHSFVLAARRPALTFLAAAALALPAVAAELRPNGDQRLASTTGDIEGDAFGESLASGDFDGDGLADLAIGQHGAVPSGRVVLYRGTGAGLVYDATLVGPSGSRFGYAVAAGDFDGNGQDELAVGMPFHGFGAVRVYGRNLDNGAPNWTLLESMTTGDLDWPGLYNQNAAWLGAALEVGDFNGDDRDDLAIGAPDSFTDEMDRAGAVAVVYGSALGLLTNLAEWWSQATPDVPGAPEPYDRLGNVLAAGDFDCDGNDDLAIGVPAENVGAAGDAGYVIVLYGGVLGLSTNGVFGFSQGSSGVPGAAETDDNFGISLAAGDFDRNNLFAPVCEDLAIGAMGEDVTVESSEFLGVGAVVVLYGGAAGLSATGAELITGFGVIGPFQIVRGLGRTLVAARFDDDLPTDLAIGFLTAHGEPGGSGGVAVVHSTGAGLVGGATRAFSQFELDVAPPRATELMGTALAAGNFDGVYGVDLAVGIPGEKDTGVLGVGAVEILYSSPNELLADGFEVGPDVWDWHP